jgi:hypothetical protein
MKALRVVLLICISLFLSATALAQAIKLDKVRQQFFEINEVKDGALNLFYRLKPLDLSGSPVLMAYRGACSAASAGSVSGVQKKLKYFNNGKDELETAVRQLPNDPEIRFLRLVTQINAPGFLGYSSNTENDKKVIVAALSKVSANDPNTYLYTLIADYLLTTDSLSSSERQIILQMKNRTGK